MAQGAHRQIFAGMRDSDGATVRMPELVMTPLGMGQVKTFGLKPLHDLGTVHRVYLYTLTGRAVKHDGKSDGVVISMVDLVQGRECRLGAIMAGARPFNNYGPRVMNCWQALPRHAATLAAGSPS